MTELRGAPEPPLDELLARLDPVDLVLVEGYKRDRHPKIEARRAATAQDLIADGDETIEAVASDAPLAGPRGPGLRPRRHPGDRRLHPRPRRPAVSRCFDTVAIVDWSSGRILPRVLQRAASARVDRSPATRLADGRHLTIAAGDPSATCPSPTSDSRPLPCRLLTRPALHTAAFYVALFMAMGVHVPFWPLWLEDWGLTADGGRPLHRARRGGAGGGRAWRSRRSPTGSTRRRHTLAACAAATRRCSSSRHLGIDTRPVLLAATLGGRRGAGRASARSPRRSGVAAARACGFAYAAGARPRLGRLSRRQPRASAR